MENTEQEGNGPESMLHFIKACRGLPYNNGADQEVGLQVRRMMIAGVWVAFFQECQQGSCEQAVRVLEAMYRSAASGKTELAK